MKKSKKSIVNPVNALIVIAYKDEVKLLTFISSKINTICNHSCYQRHFS